MNPNTPASAPQNPLRANTAFQRTAAALALNQLSDAMSLITITFMVIAMNGSPELASLVLFCCSFTAITAGIISGTIVDRMTPRRALILSCATQTLGWVGVLALSMSGSRSIVVLTLILVLLTAASQLDYPSEQKIIAATVPVTDLGRASAIGQARESAASLFGAPIAGFIAGISLHLLLAAQGLLNLVALAVVPSRRSIDQYRKTKNNSDDPAPGGSTVSATNSAAPETTSGILADFKDGWRRVLADKTLLAIAAVTGIANFATTGIPLTLIYYYQSAGFSALWVGVLMGAFGAGVLTGSTLVGFLTDRLPLSTLGICAVGTIAAGQLAAVFIHPTFWATAVVFALAGVPLPAFNASIMAYVNATTDEAAIGRVHSALGVPVMALMPAATLAAGVLFGAWGAGTTLLVFAVFMMLSLVLMLVQPGLRTLPKLSELEDVNS